MKRIIYLIAFFVILTTSYSQWELLKGPGRNKTINSVDVEGNDIYITIYNSIFKTTDLGKNWIKLDHQNNQVFAGVYSVIKYNNMLFLYTSKGLLDQNYGLYISTDDGISWLQHNEGIATEDFGGFIRFCKCESEMYLILLGHIYKYNINKNKWEKAFKWEQPHFRYTTVIEYKDKLFIGTFAEGVSSRYNYPNLLIYSKTDGSVVAIRDTISGLGFYSINSFAKKGDKLYAGSDGGLFVSTDEGLTWTKKNNGLRYEDSVKSYDYPIYGLCVKGDYMYAITSYGNIAYSSDEGESWQFPDPYKIIKGGWFPSLGAYSISIVDNKLLINLGKEGLYITSNDTLTDLQSIVEKEVFCGDIVRDMATNGEKIYAAVGYGYDNGNSGLWESTDDGNTWKCLLNKELTKVAVKDSFIIAGNDFYKDRNPYYSTDGGKTFNTITSEQGLPTFQIFAIKIDRDTIYCGTNIGIYYSGDWGSTWHNLSEKLSFPGKPIYSIESDSNYIFAGSNGNTVMISSDRGATWSSSVIPFTDYSFNIVAIKVVSHGIRMIPYLYAGTSRGGQLFTDKIYESATGRGVFFSTDAGSNWRDANFGLMDYYGVSSIEKVSASMGNRLTFISMNRFAGVYYSRLGGYYDIWRPYNKGLTNANIYKLLATDKYLFAGTDGGMYRLKLSDVGILDVNDYEVERKNYFYSDPPYPLPAGELVQARIFWDLRLDINTAEIKVYDIYGKEISDGKDITIVPESGWYGTLIWDCKGVAPGVYIITVKYGTERDVIKVVKG